MTCLDKNITTSLDKFWLFFNKKSHNQFCFLFESPFNCHTSVWLLLTFFFTLSVLFCLQLTFSLSFTLHISTPSYFLHFSWTLFLRSFCTHLERKYTIDNSFFPDRWDFQSPTWLEQNSFLTENFLVWFSHLTRIVRWLIVNVFTHMEKWPLNFRG